MKLLVLYRPNSEHSRRVEEFMRDLQMQHDMRGGKVEQLDVDSREGIATASLYGIMSYPALIITAEDGSVVRSWEGEQLPLMDEIAAYTFSA